MPRIPSLLSRPYSIATFCTLIINSRKVVYLSPNKLETFFPSQGRTAHGEYSKSIQFKSKDKEYVDVRTIRQITSGCICGFGVGLLFSTISRPLLIISVIIGAGIQLAALRGISLKPYKSLQRYMQKIYIGKFITVNRAWRSSFCITFLIAGFLKFS